MKKAIRAKSCTHTVPLPMMIPLEQHVNFSRASCSFAYLPTPYPHPNTLPIPVNSPSCAWIVPDPCDVVG